MTKRSLYSSSLLLALCDLFIVAFPAIMGLFRTAAAHVVVGSTTRCCGFPRIPSRLQSHVAREERVPPHHYGIVGGGLAGLSTAYHLLNKEPSSHITIVDKAEPGTSGASSVAGGFLHPLSPRGKLVFLGMEGLASTNQLVEAARKYDDDVVLRDEIYRVATDEVHVETLKETATLLSDISDWIDPNDLDEPGLLGALRLHSGCKVLHVPSYLAALWTACQSMGSGNKQWVVNPDFTSEGFDWRRMSSSFDTLVLAAGAGLFENGIVEGRRFPVQLVRGQSIEFTMSSYETPNAMLCGKYLSPLKSKNRVLLGATHEFGQVPLTPDQVRKELRDRSYAFASQVWQHGTVDKITTGTRVQSNRGAHGRVPIIGAIEMDMHPNIFVFTGLSSRGFLYHGVFGDLLTDMMLGRTIINHGDIDLDWWRSHDND